MLKQTFDINDNKQVHLARRFINMILYWMAQILANDYSRPMKEKIELINSYTKQIKNLENKLNLGRRLEGTLYPMLRNSPKAGIGFIKAACAVFRVGFIKAIEYDKKTKKWAKTMAKLRKKQQLK